MGLRGLPPKEPWSAGCLACVGLPIQLSKTTRKRLALKPAGRNLTLPSIIIPYFIRFCKREVVYRPLDCLTFLTFTFILYLVNRENYQRALQSAQSELVELLRDRADVDSRIARLKQTIDGLTALCDETNPSAGTSAIGMIAPVPPGLTSNIRRALAEATSPMTAPQIRNALTKMGLNLSAYANEMAVIHNTLNRLEKQREVIAVAALQGQPLWTLSEKGKELARSPLVSNPGRKGNH